MKIDLSFEMLPAQEACWNALKSGHRFILMYGGIGGGKTYFLAKMAWYLGLMRGGLGWMVAPTYKVSRVVRDTFESVCPNQNLIKGGFHKVEQYYELITGARIEIRTAERPQLLTGANVSWAVLDEAKEYSVEAWRAIRGRMRSSEGIIIIATTPGEPNHWLHQDFYRMSQENPALYFVVKAPTRENKYISKRELEDLENAYRGRWARRELEAEILSFEGLVYDCFDFDDCVLRGPIDPKFFDSKTEWGEGVDFGWESPTAVVLRAKKDGIYSYLHEIYEKKLDIKNLAVAVQDMEVQFGATQIVRTSDAADPRVRLDFIKEMREWDKKNKNYNKMGERGKGTVLKGIRMVYNLISDGKLKVHRSMTNTIEEFGSYMHYKSRDETQDKLVDAHNHALDAIRYDVEASETQNLRKLKHIKFKIPTQRVYI